MINLAMNKPKTTENRNVFNDLPKKSVDENANKRITVTEKKVRHP